MNNKFIIDNTSISYKNGLLELNGFSDAPPNTVPYKNSDNTIKWKRPISKDIIDNLVTREDVNAAIDSRVGHYDISSWKTIQGIVRAGLAQSVFAIGDQFITKHSTYGDIVWDIIGFDIDTPSNAMYKHSMTIQSHNAITNFCVDSRDAYWVATKPFTITPSDTVGFEYNGKKYKFTVLANVSVEIGYALRVEGVDVASSINMYKDRSASSVAFSKSPTTIDLSEHTSCNLADYGVYNDIKHNTNCSNKYSMSLIRQWLNSTADSNSWWTYQYEHDMAPTRQELRALPGFLRGFDNDFLSAIGCVDKVSYTSNHYDGEYEIISDKMFLLSDYEIYGKEISHVNRPYQYYMNNSSLQSPGISPDTNRIKYLDDVACVWWLRTPYLSSTFHSHTVSATGQINRDQGNNLHAIVPACCIV